MPINIKPGETEEQFIGRCIGIEIGAGKDQDQATAICYSVWENRNMKKTTQQSVNAKINDIGRKQELITPNPCQEGYVAIGLKPKGGRLVPNCVPQD